MSVAKGMWINMEKRAEIITVINYFSQQTDDSLFDFSKVKGKGKPVIYGGWEGKASIADDFNAPIDDFEEYM